MDKKSRALVGHKIKSAKDVKKIISKKIDRKNKIILCHGTFDIVHPGHIRHLLYAKSRADVLVVSLTSDKHIRKGNMRPYVPQDMRAFNLAALSVVDYVIIDEDPTPIKNIKLLEPDYYGKGYEYGKSKIITKTQEEIDTLKTFDGEILFTPGDIVYSSSSIITSEKPNISLEKMIFLMEAEGITFSDLKKSLARIKGLKVHVVGDTIVDSYTKCSMIGGMTKTPTMSVKYEEKIDYLGGAGIVAKHIKAAGAEVKFTTVLGLDDLGTFVIDDLKKSKIKTYAVLDKSRPTTNKNAVVVGNYRLLKIDKLDNTAINGNVFDDISKSIESTSSDIVVFSDFRHGIFNKSTINHLSNKIPDKAFRVADSQVASRWGNILEFQNFDLKRLQQVLDNWLYMRLLKLFDHL